MTLDTLGNVIRALAKSLVWEFMKTQVECQPGKQGITQAEIFRDRGLDWGDYPVANSGQQQYWVTAIL